MSQVVIGDILPYTQATAILNQTVFMTNWTANTESDVVVYQTPSGNPPNDVTQILPYPAGYSVAFIGASQEVQVTLVTPAGAGDIITITRQTPADRMNLYTNTNFLPSMLNNDFGILTLVDQQAQLVNQLIGLRYNYSATIVDVVDTIIPILGANQTWVKNPSNTAIITYTLPASGIAPANATYVTVTNETSVLPNSVNFAGLSPGIVAFTGSAFVSNPILGTTNEITVTNATGVAGSVTLSFPDNMIFPGTGSVGLPGGTTGQRVITASGTPFRYNSTFDSLEFYSNGTWSLLSDDTDGIIIPANAGQIAYYATTGNNLSGLPAANGAVLVTDNSGVASLLSGSASTGRYLQSVLNGAPIFSAITWPTDVTTYQLLYAGSNHVVNALNPADSAVLCSTQTGAPDWVGPLSNGQIIIGSTGALPVAATLTQGSGILITLGAGTITVALNVAAVPALTMAGNIDFANTYKAINAIDPTNPQDYATKNYVDQNALSGTSVYAATINTSMNATQSGAGVGATLTDASGTFAALSLDSTAIPLNADVLVKNTGTGVTAANEGIYKLTTNGDGISIPWKLTRSVEYDTPTEINNTGLIVVQNGSTLAGTGWYNSATIITVDTTNFNFNQFGSGGTVTSIATNNGITGGTITTTGTIGLQAAFSINASAASSSFVMNAAGEITKPNNPAFSAYVTSTSSAVTGDGTLYTVISWTKNYDVQTSFNATTGTFTAPVAGTYMFQCNITLGSVAVTNTQGLAYFTGGTSVTVNNSNWAVGRNLGTNQFVVGGTMICDLGANGTVVFNIQESAAGSKNVTVIGGQGNSTFSGCLIG